MDFLTLFPELVLSATSHSILGRAVAKRAAQFSAVNPRDFTYDRNNKVDDTPFGGEPGMLLKAEPVYTALESIRTHDSAVILTDPAAPQFRQSDAVTLSRCDHVIFLCGHYEGIDHRVADFATHAFSIGDYVLTNGELPALVMADAIVRLLPGVLGSELSLGADSHSDGLLSAPNYTRPEIWRDRTVPEVLRRGNHRAIECWRRGTSLRITRSLRPDLLALANLEKSDLDVLSS